MYNIQLKKGSYEYGPFRKTSGLDLDHWLFDLLRKYGKVPVRSCCGVKNLHLKQGTFKKSMKPSGNLFNLEKYFIKILKEYGVITQPQIDANCCVNKNQLYITKDYVYFSDIIEEKKSNILKWLKKKLTEYQISHTDPCCPPPYPVFQKFYVAFVDAGQLNGNNYRKLYQTGCIDNPTKSGLPWMMHMEDMDVNGTVYSVVDSDSNLIDPTQGLTHILNQFVAAGIPDATFTWVSADNGVVAEPNKSPLKNANYFWLVMTLPGAANSVYSYETFYDSTPASAITPINLAMSSMVVDPIDIFDYNNCNASKDVVIS